MKPVERNNTRPLLEICCGSLKAVEEAVAGGADRVELCTGLAEGGMTPSAGLIRAAVATGIPVNVLIRPRPGDFCYTRREERIMADDILMALDEGASGIVIGALTPFANLSCRVLDKLITTARRACPKAGITLHRAFDMCRYPEQALDIAARHGFDRILTSGCAASAMNGFDTLRRLKELAGDKIKIMAGGGINAANAPILAQVAHELHASARRPLPSPMIWRRQGVPMGLPDSDEYTRKETDREEIKSILKALKR